LKRILPYEKTVIASFLCEAISSLPTSHRLGKTVIASFICEAISSLPASYRLRKTVIASFICEAISSFLTSHRQRAMSYPPYPLQLGHDHFP